MIPKNKNQILLGSRDGQFVDNTKYFFLYLLKKKTPLNFIWITKNKELFQKFKKLNFPVVYLYSLEGFITILKSNIILVNQLVNDASFFIILPGNFNIVNLWHGTPFKRITVSDMKHQNFIENRIKRIMKKVYHQQFKCAISASDITTSRLKEAFDTTKEFPILGYPRNDVFLNTDLIFENYKDTLGLNNYSKIYLYCPTLRDAKSKKPFSNSFLATLNQYLLEKNSIFLIKWHPYEKNEYTMDNFSHIFDITKKINDLQELLPLIDILITDYSSVSYDFILLNKPIIFYPYDYDDYIKKSRSLYGNYFEEFPGPFVKNEDDLFKELLSIETFFKNSNEYNSKYNKFKMKFNHFIDDKSCERVYEYLIKIIK